LWKVPRVISLPGGGITQDAQPNSFIIFQYVIHGS